MKSPIKNEKDQKKKEKEKKNMKGILHFVPPISNGEKKKTPSI
jgi:hypothetical protein